MNKTVYVCEGTCAAKISEEQYKGGLTKCGADVCTLKGHEFTKMFECDVCHEVQKEDTTHPHH